jgi:predicted transposase/invertase (TIGR01784 family)
VKTDSIFFRIFQTRPSILFELLGVPSELGDCYDFQSVEVKQTAFRIDGVFVPRPDALDRTVIFAEVQFQSDEYLYDRMFAEIGLYLVQHRDTFNWRAVAIFPRRSLEPKNQYRHRTLLGGEQFTAIYLENLLNLQSDLLGIQIMQLIVSKPKESQNYVQKIVAQFEDMSDLQNQAIIELVCTVMVYKFPELSREAIEAMFSVSELKQTKVYQEALNEGRVEGRVEGLAEGRVEGRFEGRREEAQSLILRMLARRFGAIDGATKSQICSLSLGRLEDLGEALLEFRTPLELKNWLEMH